MRVIRLSHGAGNGVDRACLMTATNMLIGRGQDGDRCGCVCAVIRQFIIRTNDCMKEEWLPEIYGDLPWEIMGTRTKNKGVMLRRAYHFADVAIRQLAPIALEARGFAAMATKLRELPPVIDAASASAAAADAADAANAAYAASAARACSHAAYAASAARAAYAACAARAAADAAEAAAYVDENNVWFICRQAIIDACKIGDRRPVECVITRDQLCDALA